MYEGFYFEQLQEKAPKKAQEILNYKLSVYACSGSDAERLDCFETLGVRGVFVATLTQHRTLQVRC